jgi:hypothetical protein
VIEVLGIGNSEQGRTLLVECKSAEFASFPVDSSKLIMETARGVSRSSEFEEEGREVLLIPEG